MQAYETKPQGNINSPKAKMGNKGKKSGKRKVGKSRMTGQH
jgi:hypothetical protein